MNFAALFKFPRWPRSAFVQMISQHWAFEECLSSEGQVKSENISEKEIQGYISEAGFTRAFEWEHCDGAVITTPHFFTFSVLFTSNAGYYPPQELFISALVARWKEDFGSYPPIDSPRNGDKIRYNFKRRKHSRRQQLRISCIEDGREVLLQFITQK